MKNTRFYFDLKFPQAKELVSVSVRILDDKKVIAYTSTRLEKVVPITGGLRIYTEENYSGKKVEVKLIKSKPKSKLQQKDIVYEGSIKEVKENIPEEAATEGKNGK